MNVPDLPNPPQRILIIKPSSIGDVVHALPVLHLLRRRFPQAQIRWLVTPACAGLLEGHPLLDGIELFERRRLGKWWRHPGAMMDLWRLSQALRSARYDLVIDLQGLFRSGVLAWQTRAPARVGFANAREMSWLAYTHRVPIQTMEQHAVDRYLQVAAAVGCETMPVEFHLAITGEVQAQMEGLVGKNRRYAVLIPGANWTTKRWPVANYAALVKPLRRQFYLETIVAGGSDDIDLARQIPADLNLAGKTSLPQLVALLQRADLVIANDSGPMHIASALARPLVAIFGPTNPVRTGPYGRMDSVVRNEIPCAPCYSRKCDHQSCLMTLGIEPVLQKAAEQLAKRPIPS